MPLEDLALDASTGEFRSMTSTTNLDELFRSKRFHFTPGVLTSY